MRQRLKAIDAERLLGRVALGQGLSAGGSRGLVWTWTPPRRGRWRVELESVGSLFPFGFLKKHMSLGLSEELLVWPAPIVFDPWNEAASTSMQSGRRTKKVGEGNDLLSLRKYEPGDSHRLIHWKASARQRQLMIRQCSSEADQAFSLHFDSEEGQWPEPEAFEVAVRLAAALAEDLHGRGRLRQLGIDATPPVRVRRFSDLEAWLDRMALAMPSSGTSAEKGSRQGRGLIQFKAQGPKGAAAYVDGRKVTSA